MPTKTLHRSKSKKSKTKALRRKLMTKRAKKKVAKRVAKKVTKKMIRKAARPSPKRRLSRAKSRGPAGTSKVKAIGKVTHYYDRIGVAIVELKAPLRLGDMVHIKRGDRDLLQSVTSLQIDHTPVASAKCGDVIGMKVSQEVHQGAVVTPA